jgi:hypothetical protein
MLNIVAIDMGNATHSAVRVLCPLILIHGRAIVYLRVLYTFQST